MTTQTPGEGIDTVAAQSSEETANLEASLECATVAVSGVSEDKDAELRPHQGGDDTPNIEVVIDTCILTMRISIPME